MPEPSLSDQDLSAKAFQTLLQDFTRQLNHQADRAH
jgi:hypothetical protein